MYDLKQDKLYVYKYTNSTRIVVQLYTVRDPTRTPHVSTRFASRMRVHRVLTHIFLDNLRNKHLVTPLILQFYKRDLLYPIILLC